MEITDLYGKTIEITDLTASIRQAKLFMGYKHEGNGFEAYDKERHAYWQDIYSKLLQLKENIIGNNLIKGRPT